MGCSTTSATSTIMYVSNTLSKIRVFLGFSDFSHFFLSSFEIWDTFTVLGPRYHSNETRINHSLVKLLTNHVYSKAIACE